MKKNTTPKVKAPTIAEERAELAENPVIHFDLLTARRIEKKYITAILRPLSAASDYILIDMGHDQFDYLPVKPLRDWLKVVTAEIITITPEPMTASYLVEYTEDGIKGRARFLMCSKKDVKLTGSGMIVTVINETPAAEVEKKVDSWIAKACSKDDSRPYQKKSYGKFATDGYRLHYDRRLDVSMPSPDYASPQMVAQIPDVLSAASHVDNCALVNVDALIAAMKQMRKANKQTACLYVNGRLDVSTTASNDMISVIRNIVTDGYQHSGDNVSLNIDPQYVIDALSGMTGDVVLGISELTGQNGRTLYISDGQREAVIMSKAA